MSDLAEKVERAVVYTPQAGDVVVLELDSLQWPRGTQGAAMEIEQLQSQAIGAFGPSVRVVVLGPGIKFAGVTRECERPALRSGFRGVSREEQA